MRTLVQGVAEGVVGGDEVERGLWGGLEGRDGVYECGQGGFDARELDLEYGVHDGEGLAVGVLGGFYLWVMR